MSGKAALYLLKEGPGVVVNHEAHETAKTCQFSSLWYERDQV
jgi:hypothetical protein